MDLRRGCRAWLRAPTTALSVIVLVALGMGGVAALFTPLYALMVAPLPFPRSDQLVRIGGNIPLYNLYSNTFEEPERLGSIFSQLAAYAPAIEGISTRLGVAGAPLDVSIQAVTPNFFAVMGERPRMGRGLPLANPTAPAVVISHRLWTTRLASAADVIDSPIHVGDQLRVIVGVMPKDFDFPVGADIWLPIQTVPHSTSSLELIGRLRADRSVGRAAAELKAIEFPHGGSPTGTLGKEGPVLQPLQTYLHGDQRSLLRILGAVSALFLVLACAGAVNLLLAHGVRRRSEIAVRLALGATRSRLVRQLLTEILLVVAAGGVLGLLISAIGSRWLQAQLPALGTNEAFVPATLALGAVLVVAVTIACGVAPALRATSTDMSACLKSGTDNGSTFSSGRRVLSAREYFAVVQLVIALGLVISAGLLLRSLTARIDMPLGLNTQDVVVFRAVLPQLPSLVAAREKFYDEHGMNRLGSYGPRRNRELMETLARTLEPERRAQEHRNSTFFVEARERLRSLREVGAVEVMSPAPFTAEATQATQMSMHVYRSNPTGAAETPLHVACIHGEASPGAFDLLGIRLTAGTGFTQEDVTREQAMLQAKSSCKSCPASAAGVAIVNEALVQRFWPDENPIGKEFYDPPFHRRRVVGVVSSFYQSGHHLSIVPAAYYPFTGVTGRGHFVVKLRPGEPVKQLAAEANRILREIGPALPSVEVSTMEGLTAKSLINLRLALRLLACFSLMGTLVAGLGVYATATLTAAARRREMAIRVALGADTAHVRRLTLWRSARLALLGTPVGLVAGWALARGLSHLLFQVGATDPLTYVTSSIVLLAVVMAAGLLPALGASSTPTATALRQE